MKKNSTKHFFTAILLIHILVYFFKIDKDVFAFTEYVNRPNQTYTEQPLSKNVSYSHSSRSDFSHSSQSCTLQKNNFENISIWKSILLSYNSRVHHLLKLIESYSAPKITFHTILYRQNIAHKSSGDEDFEFRFYHKTIIQI